MRRLLAALLLAAAVSACRGPPPREFGIVGQIQAVSPERGEVTIKHQDIKGLMPGMTMPFKAGPSPARRPQARRPGDRHARGRRSGRAHLEADRHRPPRAPPTPSLPADGSAIIQPGDAVKDATLVDQDGKTRRLSEWRGHRLALTFVYTRCPLPEFCPLMNQHFGTVQSTIAKTPALGDVHLLSVSMDPAYDTPKVLKPFATGAGARSGPLDVPHRRTGRGRGGFSWSSSAILVERTPANEVQITHNLRTAVIGADGRLKSVHTGNRWKPDELVADLAATSAAAN